MAIRGRLKIKRLGKKNIHKLIVRDWFNWGHSKIKWGYSKIKWGNSKIKRGYSKIKRGIKINWCWVDKNSSYNSK